VRLYSEEASDADRAGFRSWLQAHPSHASTYRALELAWRDIGLVAGAGTAALPSANDDTPWFRRPAGQALAAAACLLLLVGTGFFTLSQNDQPGWHTTGTGQIETVTLEDGSRVTLGARSSLETRFTETVRQTRLVQGTAYFDVAKNANRPFVVTVAETAVTVTGTAFDIRLGPDAVRVAVTEGSVRVADTTPAPAQADAAPALLGAGDQLTTLLDGTVSGRGLFDPQEIAAWRDGRLVYLDARLADIVADANRYRQIPIRLRGDSLADLRISTSFRVDQSDQMLAGLAASYAVDIRKTDYAVTVQTKK
jgi:transmembrane sensor